MANLDHEKFLAAQAATEYVRDGMIVGLGTGSTAAHVVKILGDRLRAGLRFRAIPTSRKTRELATAEGIPLIGFEDTSRLDVTIDGADEIDGHNQIIKGGGGALLHERIVASASDLFIVVGDSTKRVQVLGSFPLPVEVVPFAWALVAARIEKLGAKPVLRRDKAGHPALTDEENFILDCHFGRIERPAELAATLRAMSGVVDQGLFINYPDVVILGAGETVQKFDVRRTTARQSP